MSQEGIIVLIKHLTEIRHKVELQLIDSIMTLPEAEIDNILNSETVAWQWIESTLETVIEAEKNQWD